MLPLKIKPYLTNIREKSDDNCLIIEGELSCCGKQEFEMSFDGLVRKSFLTGTYIYAKDDKIVLEAKCKCCGKKIVLFHSSIDGYAQCQKNIKKNISSLKSFDCIKCKQNNFAVIIKYEYSDLQELKEEGIDNIDNAYSWIWISLKCNECNTKYRKFFDFETA